MRESKILREKFQFYAKVTFYGKILFLRQKSHFEGKVSFYEKATFYIKAHFTRKLAKGKTQNQSLNDVRLAGWLYKCVYIPCAQSM